MPEEILTEAEATMPATKRKAPAKKAVAKKAAVIKVAVKKAAVAKVVETPIEVVVEAPAKKPAAKPARKAVVKKAKLRTADDEMQPEFPMAPEIPVVPAVITPATPPPAPVFIDIPVATETVVAAPVVENTVQVLSEASSQSQPPEAPKTANERRKSKFERWKERQRQRALERQQARQNGGGGGHEQGGQPNGDRGDRGDRGGDRQDRGNRHERNDRNGASQDFEPARETPQGPPEPSCGILELSPKGYGFLRQRDRAYAQHPQDAFVTQDIIRQYGLREGMEVKGVQCKGNRGPQVTEVTEVNVRAPEAMRDLPIFEELKAINPNKRIQLETHKDRLTTRVIDMFTPVGRGQRGLIVAPPRAGKTTLLQHIAEAVAVNHPTMHLMVLLVDERPEEVTEFKRALPSAELFASSNDQDIKSHTRIAQFAIERAKRLVECGEHVFLLMDSITRMARAFNSNHKSGGTMSGGVGVGALEVPRRLFAAARNTRTAGSLTILATALIETGSKMDELIFQEFKGTGNMELVLDRKIAEQFYYPAVNIFKSGTRREELLLQAFQLDKIHMLRRGLAGGKPIDAIQRVLTLLERYPSNAQMLVDLPSKAS